MAPTVLRASHFVPVFAQMWRRRCRGGLCFSVGLIAAWLMIGGLASQAAEMPTREQVQAEYELLKKEIAALPKAELADRELADVAVCEKALEWGLRHEELKVADDFQKALKTAQIGRERAASLMKKQAPWVTAETRVVLGYQSNIDGSFQPYAVTLPPGHDIQSAQRWAVHVVLHGRDDKLTEIRFFQSHTDKKPAEGQDWIQVDVYGRGNNAYRWSGETDVFEALADLRARYRIDDRRIVLHGFSMGGAGAWHLGLHYPSQWCSVGPGAGFVDFYKYTKTTQPLPEYQDQVLHIYDPVDYVLNAFNVPVLTYGGEKDAQLVASSSMKELADKIGVPMKMIIGPGVGHTFHPDSLKEFMAFHHEKQLAGRPPMTEQDDLRFTTWSLKYNHCNWLTIEEMGRSYHPAIVEGSRDEETGRLKLKTKNCAVIQIARDMANEVDLDGSILPLFEGAEGLLPGVYYESSGDSWRMIPYDRSLNFSKNLDLHKRHNLQGPIDDAFMQPFVCVVGTGTPWNNNLAGWSQWTLERLQREFDQHLRGQVQVVKDSDVTTDMMKEKHLILFGDPGSNSILAKGLSRLPVQWTQQKLTVNGKDYSPDEHGVALIHPNPLNPRRYIVVNSGHTFHADDFKKSNAWLFPRLGDLAVIKFSKQEAGGYQEQTVWATVLNNLWKFPKDQAAGK